MKLLTVLFTLLLSQASFALGPLDGEATIEWWNTELSDNVFDGDIDAGTLNLNAQGWWDQGWGIQGGISLSDSSSGQFEDQQRFNFNLNRYLFSPTDNTYISAGLGWENIQLKSGDSTNGLRLSLRGQIGFIGLASLYGQSTWLPTLGDTNDFSNISGTEFETGIVFEPLPFISLKAGYRRFKLDYDFSGSTGGTTSSGFILGTGIHW
ncbi:MAG: hypothetical protein ACI9J2_001803 [Saprospiraceae bacterium]|jgi:hypothetical protein